MGSYVGFVNLEAKEYFDPSHRIEGVEYPSALDVLHDVWVAKYPLWRRLSAIVLAELMRFGWRNHTVTMVGDDWTGGFEAPYLDPENGYKDALLVHKDLVLACLAATKADWAKNGGWWPGD